MQPMKSALSDRTIAAASGASDTAFVRIKSIKAENYANNEGRAFR